MVSTQTRVWLGLLWDMEKYITEHKTERLKTCFNTVHIKAIKNKIFFKLTNLKKYI